MAAVSVVLPWSMCPIVPTLTWGLVLDEGFLGHRDSCSASTAFVDIETDSTGRRIDVTAAGLHTPSTGPTRTASPDAPGCQSARDPSGCDAAEVFGLLKPDPRAAAGI